MGILIVFIIGLFKLWWSNRLMRKLEVLAQEKRNRLTEMRKAGISVKKAIDIPFGIRAIQHGIEVDGIWISRPATPNTNNSPTKLTSSSTLVGRESVASHKKGKDLSDESRSASASTGSRQAARQSPADWPLRSGHADPDAAENFNPAGAPRPSQFAAPKPRYPRVASALSEDTLNRLEAQGYGRYGGDTYIPTSFPSRYTCRTSKRSSSSSSAGSADSPPRSGMSARSNSIRSHSSQNSRLHSSRNTYEPQGYNQNTNNYSYVALERGEPGDRDPFGNSTGRTPVALGPRSGVPSPHALGAEPTSAPDPTSAPAGDPHMNRSTRRVNQGFEILPAGTFGVMPESAAESANRTNVDLEAARGVADASEDRERGGSMFGQRRVRKFSLMGSQPPPQQPPQMPSQQQPGQQQQQQHNYRVRRM